MYTHQCSKCEAFYIPYEKDIVCPNCGLNESDNVTWGEQLYLKNYVYELSTKVYRELQTQVDSNSEDGIKEIVILRFITLKKKLLSYFIRT